MNLDDFVNSSLIMETKYGKIKGTIKYGIRLPIRPGITPLKECDLESTRKIEGQKPSYWFVNNNQSIKVRLVLNKVNQNRLRGIGKDSKYFLYKITRDK